MSATRIGRVVGAMAFLFLSSIAVYPQAPTYSNPVIPGDFPDPSVIRVNDGFWATSTSGEWAPVFPLVYSQDLVNWKQVGSVFQTRPAWASGSFWAPEVSEYKGQYFVYYTARKIDGPLCVAVAMSKAPQGPYTDHGPLVCQQNGSIDAFATVDENGERYLIWKEDGNSQRQPTPIWARRLSPDGLELIGEKSELIRNDMPWEGQVVEGPFILRRGGYFYMFYAGAGCCGLKCDYGVGVARSRKLLGPWEKYPQNPIVTSNEKWKCPGHGSIVTDARGRQYFLFHSYRNESYMYGRQAVLEEIQWEQDGWPSVNSGQGVGESSFAPLGLARREFTAFVDEFKAAELDPGWEWTTASNPEVRTSVKDGRGLILSAQNQSVRMFGAMITRRIPWPTYAAETAVIRPQQKDGVGGLAVFGDWRRTVGIGVSADQITFWETRDNTPRDLKIIRRPWEIVHIRAVADHSSIEFQVSPDGTGWDTLGTSSGLFVPPWGGSIRLALYTGGSATAKTQFQLFRMMPESARQ